MIELRDIAAWRREAAQSALYKLGALAPISDEETEFLRRIVKPAERIRPGCDLCEEGRPAPPRLIVSGWAARLRMMPDGRRQIFSFLLPGDMIGVNPGAALPSTISAISMVEFADIAPLRDTLTLGAGQRPAGLARACALAAELDEMRLLDQIVRLGRQTAYQRVAHLFLELHERLKAVRLAKDGQFALPLTQENLADALGLSLVHVNRTLQQLRKHQLLKLNRGRLALLQMDRLIAITDFTAEPSLHYDEAPGHGVGASAFSRPNWRNLDRPPPHEPRAFC